MITQMILPKESGVSIMNRTDFHLKFWDMEE